jgi:hypothetical protein
MITIKKNQAPKLPVCKMLCDGGLHEKLNDYELTKHLNAHQITVVVGSPGSGKTSMLYSLFKSKSMLKKVYDKIFVFMPSASQASMKDNIFGQLPDEQRFEELTLETLDMAQSQFDETNAIIIDDMTVYLKDKEVQKKLRELAFNRRHMGLSIFILTQSWTAVPLSIRKVFNNAFIFKVGKREMQQVFKEMIESHDDKVAPIMKLVYDKPHQFLFVNFLQQRFFKNWDELVFS